MINLTFIQFLWVLIRQEQDHNHAITDQNVLFSENVRQYRGTFHNRR